MEYLRDSALHPDQIEAWDIAQNILGAAGDRPVTLVNEKSPVWVFLDGQEDTHPSLEPSVALRLTRVADPDQALQQARQNTKLTESLRAKGAPVLEILEEPALHRQRFVAVMSRYICKHEVTYQAHGKSVALLHNAGATLSVSPEAAYFNPLYSLSNTIAFLHAEQKEAGGYKVGDTLFPARLLDQLDQHFSEAEFILASINAYAQQNRIPYIPLQEDVQADNVRGREATLIDLDAMQLGPKEYDLGRPRTQWARQQQDGNQAAIGFTAGYRENIHTPVDSSLLRLTDKISLIKYCTAHITLSVTQLLQGRAPQEWLLQEAIQRLEHIFDPRRPWKRLDLSQKAHLANS